MEEQEEEKRIVKAVLIDVDAEEAKAVEFEHSLDNIYSTFVYIFSFDYCWVP